MGLEVQEGRYGCACVCERCSDLYQGGRDCVGDVRMSVWGVRSLEIFECGCQCKRCITVRGWV